MTLQGCFGTAGTLPRTSPRMVKVCKSLSRGPPHNINLIFTRLQVYRTFRHRKQNYQAMKIHTIRHSNTDMIPPKMHKMEIQTFAADNSMMPCEGCVFLSSAGFSYDFSSSHVLSFGTGSCVFPIRGREVLFLFEVLTDVLSSCFF